MAKERAWYCDSKWWTKFRRGDSEEAMSEPRPSWGARRKREWVTAPGRGEGAERARGAWLGARQDADSTWVGMWCYLAFKQAMWTEDTDLVIICRKIIMVVKWHHPGRRREGKVWLLCPRELIHLWSWQENPVFCSSQEGAPLAIIPNRALFTYTSRIWFSRARKLFSSLLKFISIHWQSFPNPSSACLLVWRAYWLVIIHSVNSLSIYNYDFSWFIWGILGTPRWKITKLM